MGFVSPFFHFQKDELGNVFLVLMVSGDFKVHLFLSFSPFGWGRWGGGGEVEGETNRIFLFWSHPPPPPPSNPSSPPKKTPPHQGFILFYWWNFAKF